jgi:hypothetical protein
MSDSEGRPSSDGADAARDDDEQDVLADAHEQDADVIGDELGGGLGNTADGGANDG